MPWKGKVTYPRLCIGLMSGTSMDGIDAALLETDGTPRHLQAKGCISIPYDSNFRALLRNTAAMVKKHNGDINIDDVIKHSTELHIEAVNKLLKETACKSEQIDIIGYHGQTMYHNPAKGISIAIGDGQLLANKTGIRVVNNFRANDVQHGGQGAPLAPLYHQALAMRDNKVPMAVVNCGGIANITLIYGYKEEEIISFDTGPGNCLIDQLVQQRTNGGLHMDHDGVYGNQGKVHQEILKILYNKEYYKIKPPKSLDYSDLQLIPELDLLSIEDACATLEAFTADTIVNSLYLVSADVDLPKYWVLAGGGWNNPVICKRLKSQLVDKFGEGIQIFNADNIGWHGQAIEAQTFAYLAVRSLEGMPISMPNTTGGLRPLSGGEVFTPIVEMV